MTLLVKTGSTGDPSAGGFGLLLLRTILLAGAVSFLPAVVMGPVIEFLQH